MVTFALGRAV